MDEETTNKLVSIIDSTDKLCLIEAVVDIEKTVSQDKYDDKIKAKIRRIPTRVG